MNFSDVFNSLRGGTSSYVENLEDKIKSEGILKRAYRDALLEACGGNKDYAKRLARKHISRLRS